ncbi:MAG: hypothetical protein WC044_04900 [Crocinitomicaceae bacterium]
MIRKVLNKIRFTNNQSQIADLIVEINQIRKKNSTIVLYGSPTEENWKGIANATKSLFPANAIMIPQLYSNSVFNNSETIQICEEIKNLKFKKIIFSGFAPYFFTWIDRLYDHVDVDIIYHGTISEFHDTNHQNFIEQLIACGKLGKIKQYGFIKIGLAEVFKKFYGFNSFHQVLPQPLIPKNLQKIEFDKSKIHIGIFGNNTFNKNLHNQVIHALMIDNVIVHVLDESIFHYLNLNERIVGHGKNLPYDIFLSLLASMDLNLYMSFNESYGLVASESKAIGVETLELKNTDYLMEIRSKLKL